LCPPVVDVSDNRGSPDAIVPRDDFAEGVLRSTIARSSRSRSRGFPGALARRKRAALEWIELYLQDELTR
jgi:hypothetical protein